jgi:hypothetical protein
MGRYHNINRADFKQIVGRPDTATPLSPSSKKVSTVITAKAVIHERINACSGRDPGPGMTTVDMPAFPGNKSLTTISSGV